MRLSGREDLNLRPFGPEPNALPDCATPRLCFRSTGKLTGRTPSQLPRAKAAKISTTSRSRHEKTTAAVSVVRPSRFHFAPHPGPDPPRRSAG